MADYGVGTSNRFDLLDDAERKPKAAPKAQAAAPAKAKESAPRKERAEKREKGAREGGRGRGRGRRGRGRGRGRDGNRTGNDGSRAPRREFDRRSGAGPKGDRSEKRKGAGRFNWGDKSENITEADAEVPVSTEAAPAAPDAAPVEEEEPDNTITYDEMLKQREAKLVANTKAPRQVKIDDSQWETAEILSPAADQTNESESVSKKSKTRKTLHVDELMKQHGVRSGRRGGRGGRGGRSGRQERPKLDDPNAFPALGQN